MTCIWVAPKKGNSFGRLRFPLKNKELLSTCPNLIELDLHEVTQQTSNGTHTPHPSTTDVLFRDRKSVNEQSTVTGHDSIYAEIEDVDRKNDNEDCNGFALKYGCGS